MDPFGIRVEQPFGAPPPQQPAGNFAFGDLEPQPIAPPAPPPTDPLSFIPPASTPTPSSAALPGDSAVAPRLLDRLGPEAVAELEREVSAMLVNYDDMMKDRWDREEEIEDAYAGITDQKYVGQYQGASRLVSEALMAKVDQAKARIVRGILDVKPLIRVEAIESKNVTGDTAYQRAVALQEFLEAYGRRVIRIEDVLDQAGLRFCKTGTAVLRAEWQKREEQRFFYAEDGTLQDTTETTGRIKLDVIRNRDVIVWPVWAFDWREEYEWVGHRTRKTVSQFRYWAKQIALDPQTAAEIESHSKSDVGREDWDFDAKRAQMEPANMVAEEGLIEIVELWGHRILPGIDLPVRFQLFFHPRSRKILWLDYNRLHCQWPPYVPIRYKRADGIGWGYGVGHEMLTAQHADTAYRNLEIDNLMTSAFNVVLTKMGSAADAITDRVYPGMKIPTESPQEDFDTKSLAEHGALEMIYQAQNANDYRATNATGMAAVLAGQGDPTQKSGTGTGATMALIDQAGKKFGDVDSGIRRDLCKLYELIVEMIAQFAPNDLYFQHANDDQAQVLTTMRFLMPRGASISELFRLTVEAPSASNNREMLKQTLPTIYSFMAQHAQTIFGYAQYTYPQENPAGFVPFIHRLVDFLCRLADQVVKLNEVPGMAGMNPEMDPPTPPEQQINALTQQAQQLNQEMQTYLQWFQANGIQPPQPQQSPPSGAGAPPQEASPAAPAPSQGGAPAPPSSGAPQ